MKGKLLTLNIRTRKGGAGYGLGWMVFWLGTHRNWWKRSKN